MTPHNTAIYFLRLNCSLKKNEEQNPFAEQPFIDFWLRQTVTSAVCIEVSKAQLGPQGAGPSRLWAFVINPVNNKVVHIKRVRISGKKKKKNKEELDTASDLALVTPSEKERKQLCRYFKIYLQGSYSVGELICLTQLGLLQQNPINGKGAINNMWENMFPAVLEAGSQRSWCQRGRVWWGSVSWFADGAFSLCPHMVSKTG